MENALGETVSKQRIRRSQRSTEKSLYETEMSLEHSSKSNTANMAGMKYTKGSDKAFKTIVRILDGTLNKTICRVLNKLRSESCS